MVPRAALTPQIARALPDAETPVVWKTEGGRDEESRQASWIREEPIVPHDKRRCCSLKHALGPLCARRVRAVDGEDDILCLAFGDRTSVSDLERVTWRREMDWEQEEEMQGEREEREREPDGARSDGTDR